MKNKYKNTNITSFEKGNLNNTFLVKGYNNYIRYWLKPMVNKPHILFLASIFLLMCLYLMFLMSAFSPSNNKNYEWLTVVFSSTQYKTAILPLLLGIASVVEKNNTPIIMVKCKNRVHQLFFTLKQQYFAGFLLIIVWFTAVCIFSKIVLGSIILSHLSDLMLTFLFYFLYYTAAVNISVLLNRTNVKILKRGSYVIIYLISLLTTTFLPNTKFIHGGDFTDYLLGIIIPLAVSIFFTFILKNISSKADLV